MLAIQVPIAVLLGLAAGVIGGVAGTGGTIVMLPGLALLLGFDDAERSQQHVYIAAAMGANILAMAPAAWGHYRARAFRPDLVRVLAPPMFAAILVGVLLADHMSGRVLTIALALFLAAYSAASLWRIARRSPFRFERPERVSTTALASVGAAAGLVRGLIGVGGAAVLIPMLRVVSRTRLREAVATTIVVMWPAALIATGLKLATLPRQGRDPREAMLLILALAPGAAAGGFLGATLAHRLPANTLRVMVSLVLAAAAAKLAGVF